MENNDLYQAAIGWYRAFEDCPPELHLCCPKVDDDDYATYDEPDVVDDSGVPVEEKKRRISAYEERFQNVYNLSILLGLGKEVAGPWLDEWTRAVDSLLKKCDTCVRNWHRNRDPYLKALHLSPEQVTYLQSKLDEFDRQRITEGLQRAKAILEQYGPMSTVKLVDHDMSAVLALYEALCSLPYLARPEHQPLFDFVFENTQRKKPLRMQGGIIPSMTLFLFDESPVRRRFAETAWENRQPGSITAQEWDWAISGRLADQIVSLSFNRLQTLPPGQKILRFWSGFLFILHALSEKQIINSLRAMEVSPSIYFLALEHLGTNSDEALAMVLRALQELMEKSSKAFWQALEQVPPNQLVEEIFKSAAFRPLLNKSLRPELLVTEGDSQVPALAAWMRALVRSLPSTSWSDLCETSLRHLFETFRSDQAVDQSGRATCTLAGLVTLQQCLDGFLQQDSIDTGTGLIMVNQLLNRVVNYSEIIIRAASLKPGDIYNVGISKAAMAIIHSALALDAKATEVEWAALIAEKPVQDAVNRDSGALWETFLEMLWAGQLGHFELAKAMLMATLRLRSIEQFIPKRKEQLKRELDKFNKRYQQQTTAIGKMLNRLTDFEPEVLDKLCSDPRGQTIHPIVSSLIHGEDAIREAGFQLLKAITSESQPSDAVGRMLEVYFTPFLNAFSQAVDKLTATKDANSPWSHMIPILKCSDFVLTGLCDPSSGQLRRKVLTTEEHAAVKRWWECVWQAVDHSFRMMRIWHIKIDKKVMEDFCRDVMELGNKLLAQDGVMASSLAQESGEDAISKAMREVLDPPRKCSYSLADMLQLRDKYLVMGIIETIKKLLSRLQENEMNLPQRTRGHLDSMLKKTKQRDGRMDYLTKTNLTDVQRIELLKALGEDAVIEEQFMGTKPGLEVLFQGPLEVLFQGPMKILRSAKDMRARLIPPMDVLHQAILEWDIFHEGNDPPNGYRCGNVSDTYPDPYSYKQTFFPLLINEAWRSFVTAKDETTSKPFGIKVLSRMTVDKFMEVTAAVPAQISKDRGLTEGDIVIISKGEDPLNQPQELHCLSRIWKTTYKKDTVEVVYRLNAKGNQILPALTPGSEFQVVKITNMTTIEREYAALESLQYYDLMDEILKAQPSPMLTFGDEAIKAVMDNYQLNPGQARAILNAKENDGFTLIQGPPGTGKTKTIVAMVGCLLTGVLKSSNTGAVQISRPGAGPTNGTAPSKKLLVCAPSNAAVDELVLRLKAGVKTMNGTFHKIEVLRLGRSDVINAAVKDVTLDELVKARMDAELSKNSSPSERDQLHKEAGEIKAKLAEIRPQLDAARLSDDRASAMKLQREFDELKRRQAHIGAKIDADKASGNTYARETEIKRRQIQQEILDKAQVLCATLSGSGHEMFKNLNVEFETVIIDEAAQCVELSALIPLKYGCNKCILVGDPKQLPPTVLSQSAAKYGYDQSLFVRMQKNHPKDVHLLDMQYRMHPEISRFPSKEFYEGLLQDGADMARLRLQPWHQSVLLGPYRFFDVKGSQERGPKNQSLVNEEEVKVAMQLYMRFRSDYRDIDLTGKIGIITPYKAQLQRLRQKFVERYGESITEQIEFNTTDAFQGRECEIIIFSCVRASPTGGIGFMTDIRRMNVGLTRARSSLWILGDSRALVQGEFWAKLIEDAKQRDRYTNGNIMALLSQPGPRVSLESLAKQ
uniref:5'-3' RNA helicase-like protein n=1 Tax=Chaetomium thermophilum (strain DSM 1495 / CBS 144.50 / IMI 039719) TaxID=759272 RepID=UPI00293DA1B3|nr:Chain A, 5'-3' RNA helicase-like protein [Thermochaetoides thermophila DSM 1495]